MSSNPLQLAAGFSVLFCLLHYSYSSILAENCKSWLLLSSALLVCLFSSHFIFSYILYQCLGGLLCAYYCCFAIILPKIFDVDQIDETVLVPLEGTQVNDSVYTVTVPFSYSDSTALPDNQGCKGDNSLSRYSAETDGMP